METVIRDYLEQKMQVPVFVEMPESLPPVFLLVDKTGSREHDQICTTFFAIQSYAETKAKTSKLNEKVKATMKELVELNQICNVELDTDYPFTDVSIKRYRYQALFNVTHY